MNMDIATLSEETGVNVRTIRYYVAEGLLPPPDGRGPAATYGRGHRDRLLLIRRLQDAHQPLAVIRQQLEQLDDAGVAAALAEPRDNERQAPATGYEYVRQVLGKSTRSPQPAESSPPPPRPAPEGQAPGAPAPPRSTWERIGLHLDIELHVRRPLARSDQRRLEALLEAARRIFGEKT